HHATAPRLEGRPDMPTDALETIESRPAQASTPGMEAEYRAWTALILACLDDLQAAERLRDEALAISTRADARVITVWVDAILALKRQAAHAHQAVFDTFNHAA